MRGPKEYEAISSMTPDMLSAVTRAAETKYYRVAAPCPLQASSVYALHRRVGLYSNLARRAYKANTNDSLAVCQLACERAEAAIQELERRGIIPCSGTPE